MLPEIDDIHKLIDNLNLLNVHFLKLEAERLDENKSTDDKARLKHELMVREDEKTFQARIDTVVESDKAVLQLNAVAIYSKNTSALSSEPAQKEFLEKVAFFTIWPYVRSEVHTLCDSLAIDRITLPMIQQSQISLVKNERD